ncbi:MAG: hypothetical protein Satyrvirus17_18 [Satyrvirus sp.]|uniref:Uncharacterized protein n=1 Tax=Satyrvirus sp. TaxID=2487771 RepID=A0A3G5AEA2_9VIRU|nr:MAG: hypothetical protein Satyrvirus17_18 [Satyrvirus sp.]
MVEESDTEGKMYCGIGNIPHGRVRGTPEYCIQTNQVRYYGIEAIDKKLLKSVKGKGADLLKQQLKLKKLEQDAKALIDESKKINKILESNKAAESQKKRAQKNLDKLLVKRDNLIKRLKTQRKIVETLEKERDREKKKSSKSKFKK